MKISKKLFILILPLILVLTQISFAQNVKGNKKEQGVHQRGKKIVSKEYAAEKIKTNTKSFKKDLRGTWLLEEDFESGSFPPGGWSIDFGSTEWAQAFVSGYGSGNYCTFYSSWDCNYSDNAIYSPVFSSSAFGDRLYFDYAYAPYEDEFGTYYDDMEIFYYDAIASEWYSLIYLTGDQFQTAPGTNNYFEPASNEWGTWDIEIPEYTTQIYFRIYENCSNNIYIDNIRLGTPIAGYDAAVKQVYALGRLPRLYYTNDTISAVIENLGAVDFTDLKVYLEITGANTMKDSVEISYLPSNSSSLVKFKPFNPAVNGNHVIHVTIPHTDDNFFNDSAIYYCNVNPDTYSYADTVDTLLGGIGFYDAIYFLSKHRVSVPSTRITAVKWKVPGANFGVRQVGQLIRGVVLDSNGTIMAKSDPYYLKESDLNTTVTLKVTNPIPYKINSADNYFYGGVEINDPIYDDFFWNAENQSEEPLRQDAMVFGFSQVLNAGQTVPLYYADWGERYMYQSVVSVSYATDAGVASVGTVSDAYYNSSSITPQGKVYNAGSSTATFTVTRRISPGGYVSTKTVSSLTSNSTADVTFDPWTFTSGTNYSIRDSVVLAGDMNTSNNVLTGSITPRIAKDMAILWQKTEDRDSLVRAILQDGRYANNFDTIDINYSGTYRTWKIMIANPKSFRLLLDRVRDSLKSFVDGSTAGNKKTLIVFGDRLAQSYDPGGFYYTSNPADTVFLRQYLKAKYMSQDWINNLPESGRKFKGNGYFNGITQDSIANPVSSTASTITPVNGGISAFLPSGVDNTDSSIAVSYAGTNHNSFFMTNRFSDLRASVNSAEGPVLVYTKIIDWLQSITSGNKILSLTMLIEGYYNSGTDVMTSDTVTVNIRNGSSPYNLIESKKAFLNSSGSASLQYSTVSNGVNYFIQVRHRNGLETWSRIPQMFSSNSMTYNFTSDSGKAYGFNMTKNGTKWVFFAGDVNQDGIIEGLDFSLVDNDAANFETGYISTDVNGDGVVEGSDFSILDNNASQFISANTPLGFDGSISSMNEVLLPAPQAFSEKKIDHEIYNAFKSMKSKNNGVPGYMKHEFNKGKRYVRGEKF